MPVYLGACQASAVELFMRVFGCWGLAAGGCGIFGANSGFRVGWRTAGRVPWLFFETFLLLLAKFFFWRGSWTLGYRRSATRQASFHLW